MSLNEEAKMFAVSHHGDQKYADVFPYWKHLKDVEDVLLEYGFDKENEIVLAGWLHDVLEDTSASYNDIAKHFGEAVANIVFDVTDELGKTRAIRHNRTYPKVRNNQKALIVKLADRIANVRFSKKQGSHQFDMYKKEHAEFKGALYGLGFEMMWTYLDSLFDETSV